MISKRLEAAAFWEVSELTNVADFAIVADIVGALIASHLALII